VTLLPISGKELLIFSVHMMIFFSSGTFGMGRQNLVEHTIDTGSNRPMRESLRRHPRAHLDEIDRQVNELLQNDFGEPAAM